MVKGLFQYRSGGERYNVIVDRQEGGQGYNISSSSDPTMTDENIGYDFYSSEKVMKLLAGNPPVINKINDLLTPFGAPTSGIEYQVGTAWKKYNRLDQIWGGNEKWMLRNNPYLRTRPVNIEVPLTGRTVEVGRNVVKGMKVGLQGLGIVTAGISVINDWNKYDRGEISGAHLIVNGLVQAIGVLGGPYGAGVAILYGLAENWLWSND